MSDDEEKQKPEMPPDFEEFFEKKRQEAKAQGKTVLQEGTPEFEERRKEWHEKARHVKVDDLPIFIHSMLDAFHHDYGTIVDVVATAAVAAAWRELRPWVRPPGSSLH